MATSSRRFSILGVLVLFGVVTLSGCATRRFVRNEVAGLEPRLTETSNRVTENAERIDAVDRRAQEGIQAAQAADQKATQAQTAATTADTKATNAQRTADTAQQAAQQASTRINTIESRISTLDNYTPSEPVAVMFTLDSARLSDEGRTRLDEIANQVSGLRGGYLIEVQGFTDSTGDEMYNINLSSRRAEEVKRYLVSKNVPLHRISIVGLGEEKPVAENNTRQGREQNRRVEVRVLRSAAAGTGTSNN